MYNENVGLNSRDGLLKSSRTPRQLHQRFAGTKDGKRAKEESSDTTVNEMHWSQHAIRITVFTACVKRREKNKSSRGK